MEHIQFFIVYLLFFRLAIIGVGALSIFLGFLLFYRKIENDKNQEQSKTNVSASVGKIKLNLKNAAPGTCFALFGVIIVSIMFYKGSPEMTLKMIKANENVSTSSIGKQSEELSIQLRSEDTKSLSKIVNEGHYYKKTDSQKSIQAYQKALNILSDPMNYLAWHYQKQGKTELALAISRLTVQLFPENPSYLDTLATILFKTGNHKEGVKFLKRAAQLDPRYKKKLGIHSNE